MKRERRQLGRPAAQRDRIGRCTRRLPPRPSTARSVGVATVNTAQRMYESSTEEGSTANCTHQIRFYDAKGRHGEKRIRKFRRRSASAVRMVRRTHARDRMPQHGRITAHWNLDSRCCRKARERAICDRRMHMFSQYPRESRSKARTGTGAHNHGAAGNRPCGQSRLQSVADFGLFSVPKKPYVSGSWDYIF